jgi:molybdopterin-biosynthesis enzyme MoeA-like protein
MTNRNWGIIVIGDEILSGRRQDRHLQKTIELLAPRHENLQFAHFIGDNEKQIVTTLQTTMQQNAVVFSFGGIGGTPDDLTRQCAAIAAGVPLVQNPEAVDLIEGQFGKGAYPMRIRMANLPEGCELIPNPYNQIPGFRINDHHFLPGFPVMAHPMMEWVLETLYPLEIPSDYVESAIYLHDTPESSIVETMEQMIDRYKDVRFFSLPIHREGNGINLIEFGAKGAGADVDSAMNELKSRLAEIDVRWTEGRG